MLRHSRDELVGRPVFEAFPPTENALDENGRNVLQASFERARDTGSPVAMPLHQYDVRPARLREWLQSDPSSRPTWLGTLVGPGR